MVTPLKEHYRHIRHILIVVLLLNWATAIAKIIYGIITRCTSMTADGFHSLSDGASNIIGLIGINVACQPKDPDHPYGHKKYETFFSLGIAVILAAICFNLIKEGIKRLYNPVIPQVDLISFLVMAVTLAVNLLVMNYEYRKGKILNSDILIADALHTKADIFTSLSVIVTLVVIKLGYPVLDPIATIVIALFVAHSAFDVAYSSSKVLCDTAAIVDVNRITDIILSIKGVRACHKIRTRGRPDDIHVDLHVQVSGDMHMEEAHKISYAIEETIKKNIPGVTDVIVHMEPQEKT